MKIRTILPAALLAAAPLLLVSVARAENTIAWSSSNWSAPTDSESADQNEQATDQFTSLTHERNWTDAASPCDTCDSCCDQPGTCGGRCRSCRDRLLGWIARSQPCFDDFISPMTNPVFFEDPRTLSEVRFIYLRHDFPNAAGGGTVNLWAPQIRAALTDRLSVIATKAGFITSTNTLIDDGWSDVSLGLKYNLLANSRTQTLLTAGVTYELPVGSTRTLQGNGDGLFNLFLTGGTEIAGFHWISGSGFLLPANRSAESQIWFWSNHFDHRLGSTPFYGLMEVNWYHWMGSGKNGIPGLEGGDLFNFGSTGVSGNDIVTGALGMKFKPNRNTELGVAWEVPLTNRRDVLHDRFTVDWILRY